MLTLVVLASVISLSGCGGSPAATPNRGAQDLLTFAPVQQAPVPESPSQPVSATHAPVAQARTGDNGINARGSGTPTPDGAGDTTHPTDFQNPVSHPLITAPSAPSPSKIHRSATAVRKNTPQFENARHPPVIDRPPSRLSAAAYQAILDKRAAPQHRSDVAHRIAGLEAPHPEKVRPSDSDGTATTAASSGREERSSEQPMGYIARWQFASIQTFDVRGRPTGRFDAGAVVIPPNGLPFYERRGILVRTRLADQDVWVRETQVLLDDDRHIEASVRKGKSPKSALKSVSPGLSN